MSDAKNKNVNIKICVDGECVYDNDTHGMLVIDDNGSLSMNIDGLTGAVFMVREASNHFSHAIIEAGEDAPLGMTKAKCLEQIEVRMMLTAMCSSMAAFGEAHDLKEFRDAAEKLHYKALEILDELDSIETKDAED